MSLIAPINRGIAVVPRRSFITTGTFHTEIFKYTTAVNAAFQTVGTLTTLDAAGTGTAVNCPGNRILRENGRVIAPDANPVSFITKANGSGGSVTTTALTLQTVLIGVYDANSGLSGFIDPNSSKFQLYNGNKSYQQLDGVNPVTGVKDNLGANALLSVSSTPAVGATAVSAVIDASVSKVFKISLDSTMTANTTITVTTTTVPVAGSVIYIVFSSGPAVAFTKTLAFTTGFLDEGNQVVIPTNTPVARYVFTFVSDGTTLFEVARNVGVITSTYVGLPDSTIGS
jgi:hypothetical protein